MNTFELKNEQRIYFGLNPVNKNWDRVEFPKGLVCYFSDNIIEKVIIFSQKNPNNYTEFDTKIPTNNRTKLIPKTEKGKEKTITPTTVIDYNLSFSSFNIIISKNKENEQNIAYFDCIIGNQKLDIQNNTDSFKNLNSLSEFEKAANNFIATLSDNHLEQIEKLKLKKEERTKPVRFKSGDFFAVPVKFDLYGNPTEYNFGRHLLNIADLRKKGIVENGHHWNTLMTVVQLVKLYDFNSNSLEQDLKKLKTQHALPTFHMMDNSLMRGGYPIIGNIPLEIHELTFPMHYGRYIDQRSGYFFGWGICMLDNVKEIPKRNTTRFNNNGVSSGSDQWSLKKYRDGESPYSESEIEHPQNKDLKNEIFKNLGVDPGIDYDEFCNKFGFKNRAELLKLAK
ncbi:MAG: hypothetical protein EOO19_00035 [Chryseobacterium sp.]|nr:MAG: hypothetical protein EOO19_00035 [Chryseobacterium sp.]